MEEWFLFALSGSFLHSISTVIDKYILDREFDIVLTAILKMLFNGSLLLIVALSLLHLDVTLNTLFGASVLGVIYGVSGVIYYKSLKSGDVGEVAPYVQSGTMLLIFVFSLMLFGEYADIPNYLGVVLASLGIYILLSKKGFLPPILNKGVLFMSAAIVLNTIHSLLSKWFLFDAEPMDLIILMYLSAAFTITLYNISSRRSTHKIFSYGFAGASRVLVSSVFASAGTFFIYLALSIGEASRVYTTVGSLSIFVFLIAVVFLKEKFYLHRLAGIISAVLGIYLIYI
ncbi:MAG: DMT family transporter [Candidatus Altiarchaeota archaeon]|nr:DMT family transporter [Candidatus Altiarchaeota archaeon]